MIKHRADSIKELNDKQAAEAEKDKTIAEQADTIDRAAEGLHHGAGRRGLWRRRGGHHSMSKIVELYVKELTREGSTMTINDVPKKLRKQVEDAIAALKAAANAGTAEEGATE